MNYISDLAAKLQIALHGENSLLLLNSIDSSSRGISPREMVAQRAAAPAGTPGRKTTAKKQHLHHFVC